MPSIPVTVPAMDSKSMDEIIAALRQRRLDLRMSMEAVGNLVPAGLKMIDAWEHRRKTPRFENLLRWHRVLDMRLMSFPLESAPAKRQAWQGAMTEAFLVR